MAAYQYVYHMDGVSKTFLAEKNALKIYGYLFFQV